MVIPVGVKAQFKALLNELYETLSSKDVINIINDSAVLREAFIKKYVELVEDELRHSNLYDFLDNRDNFGIKYDLSYLLKRLSE